MENFGFKLGAFLFGFYLIIRVFQLFLTKNHSISTKYYKKTLY